MEDVDIIDRIHNGDKEQEKEISALDTRVTVLETSQKTEDKIEKDDQSNNQWDFQKYYMLIAVICSAISIMMSAYAFYVVYILR